MSNHQSLEDSDLASPELPLPRVPKTTGKRGERQDAIPRKSVYRLSIYQRCLRKLKDNHVVTVSSEALARAAGVKSTQLRKDLAYFGQFGPVLWAPGNVRLRMIVRALPVTVAGPVVKLPAVPAWPGALQPGTTMQPHQRNGVPGQRVVFAHRSTPRGYLPVMEASADLLNWEQVDPRMVTAYDYDSQELFIPETQIAAQPKRFYRGSFIHLDATP